MYTRGKPKLPKIIQNSSLHDYVSEKSAIFPERFCPGYDVWLTQNAPWDGLKEYQDAKKVICAISPINDTAERLCAVAKKYRVIQIIRL